MLLVSKDRQNKKANLVIHTHQESTEKDDVIEIPLLILILYVRRWRNLGQSFEHDGEVFFGHRYSQPYRKDDRWLVGRTIFLGLNVYKMKSFTRMLRMEDNLRRNSLPTSHLYLFAVKLRYP